jgi:uncharacterized membrane protein
VAVAVGYVMLRPRSPLTPLTEGRRLLEAIGWAAVLPQMLATLGQLFVAAGVGKQVGRISKDVLPEGSLFWGRRGLLRRHGAVQMRDKYGPITAQIPTAIPLLVCNVALMYFLAF